MNTEVASLSVLEGISSEAESLSTRLAIIADRLERVLIRARGTLPADASAEPSPPRSDGVAFRIADYVGDGHKAARSLEEIADEFDRIV